MPEEKLTSRFKVNVKSSVPVKVDLRSLRFFGIILGLGLAVRYIVVPVCQEMEYKTNERELKLLTKDPKSEEDKTYL